MENKKQQTLKRLNIRNSIMRSAILFIIFIFAFSIASADQLGIQYFQEKRVLNNNTIENYASLAYGNSSRYDDIPSGQPLESYVYYHADVSTWNTNSNQIALINYCELKIIYESTGNGNNSLITLYDVNLTEDLDDGKYFIHLKQNDAYYVYGDCFFNSSDGRNYSDLTTPLEFALVTPTYRCSACQGYIWAKNFVYVTKYQNVNGYNTNLLKRISGVLSINYTFLLILFYVLLFEVFYAILGIMFYGFYYFLNYLRRVAK